MKPVLFTIPFLPEWLGEVKSYGVAMMIAFLTGIWLACRRADRSQANPDTVLNLGFISLIFGVIGARAMFVIHYWETRFANQPDPLLAIINIHAGGLEFWGGPLLVIPACIIYLRFVAKTSLRWYLDIGLPSLAWGLAITRVGCFLNGCCWGAVCLDEHHPDKAALPWAVEFPFGSNAVIQQYKFGQLTLPKELIHVLDSGESFPLPREPLEKAVEDDGKTWAQLDAAKKQAFDEYEKQKKAGADKTALTRLDQARQAAGRAISDHLKTEIGFIESHGHKYGLTPRQLGDLAALYPSKPAHPSQLYAVINAFIIYWVLSTIFYYRKRHGVILGWLFVLYSISRIFLEAIRSDNPLDTFGGLTISQGISLTTLAIGLIWLWIMYRLPMYSPRAVPFVYADEESDEQTKKN
ncbi:MAG: prolipoprotein diacylglyceryl transferase [Phycisphaerales bacterium]|nr:prolipoprotein diacylglyceryl transferase [Phycisphaerales bacterium]